MDEVKYEKQNATPLISVVMSVYNEENYLQ